MKLKSEVICTNHCSLEVMKRNPSFWLMGIVALLCIGLISSQIAWVLDAAQKQEEQFDKQTQLALESIESKIMNDEDLRYSVDCCMSDYGYTSCKPVIGSDDVWLRTDSMISSELQKYEIDLDYEFDFCYTNPDGSNKFEAYERNMDKVFDQSGIVLFLEFPDKSKFLRQQIGPVFISAVLMTIVLSFLFVLIFRNYRKERQFSQRTRDFINNMTHEFQTPLTNISLANGMIERSVGKENQLEKIKQYTAIITEENERLAKNCEDLLQMARLENLDEAFTQEVNTHSVIQKVIASRSSAIEDLKVELELNAKQFKVLGSESLFYNTVSNLVDNAIKYSINAPLLVISTSNEKGMLHIQVKDHGIGMKAEHVDQIFDKFYRISEGDKHTVKGFGLGLAYVKMVITKMSGQIKVESKLGSGTTFKIAIPTLK